MRGDVETIKERLDIAEVVREHVKLDKAGQSYKGRCPFHNEKTPSFFVSPVRQSYYCFGCGAKGDIFTFVEEMEGLSFKEALKSLAEKAGVELESRPQAAEERSEKEKLLEVLETAALFFQEELKKSAAGEKYLAARGINEESVKHWRLGYAPAEWRSLYTHMLALGYQKEILIKAGLVKTVTDSVKEPYDVFRDRIIFPLSDASGEIVAFSGRALQKDSMPKYLNSPETPLFSKSELLYGLDKAKDKIRKKDYAVLVEGQIDLVLSHQAKVDNTVASSGTAFTERHLERLKRLSKRIILAFDGDNAGRAAAEKATELAMRLGLEVKIAALKEGEDPAELVQKDKEAWKEVLREAKPAIEHFLSLVLASEKDARKRGLMVGKKILPLMTLLPTSIEKSHFISLIAQKTGLKEDVLWDDLKRTKPGEVLNKAESDAPVLPRAKRERADEYQEIAALLKETPGDKDLLRHEAELKSLMRIDELEKEINELRLKSKGEGGEDEKAILLLEKLKKERDEERRKVL